MKRTNLHIYISGEQYRPYKVLDLLTEAASTLGFVTALVFLVTLG